MGGIVGGKAGGVLRTVGSIAASATPWGAIAMGASSLLGLGQTIAEGIRARRERKRVNELLAQRPTYKIPEAYNDIIRQYSQLQQQGMPGYEQIESNLGEAFAAERGRRERGAISSNTNLLGDAYEKELEAIQNLGIQQAQYKTAMAEKVIGAQGDLAQQQLAKQNWDDLVSWQTRLNASSEGQQAGIQNMYAGMQGMSNTFADFAGTEVIKKVYASLYPKGLPAQEEKKEEEQYPYPYKIVPPTFV